MHTKVFLGPTWRQTKSGEHFVEDENGALLIAEVQYSLKIAAVRHQLMDRLHHHRCNIIVMSLETLTQCTQIIEGKGVGEGSG